MLLPFVRNGVGWGFWYNGVGEAFVASFGWQKGILPRWVPFLFAQFASWSIYAEHISDLTDWYSGGTMYLLLTYLAGG